MTAVTAGMSSPSSSPYPTVPCLEKNLVKAEYTCPYTSAITSQSMVISQQGQKVPWISFYSCKALPALRMWGTQRHQTLGGQRTKPKALQPMVGSGRGTVFCPNSAVLGAASGCSLFSAVMPNLGSFQEEMCEPQTPGLLFPDCSGSSGDFG